MTTGSQLVNHIAPCKLQSNYMPKIFKTSTSSMGRVAIDSGGCKSTSLLSDTQSEWHEINIPHPTPQVNPAFISSAAPVLSSFEDTIFMRVESSVY